MPYRKLLAAQIFEQHIQDKKLTPCNFNCSDLEWQAYFGYLETPNQYGQPVFHDHDFYELILTVHSERRFFINDMLFTAQRGDVILFPPNMPHRGMDIHPAPYKRYYLYFHPAFFRHIPDGDQLEAIFRFRNRCLISFPQEERERILSMFSEFRDRSPASALDRVAMCAMILDFLVRLNRRAQELSDTPPINNAVSPLLSNVLKYMNTNFVSIPTTAALAQQFRVSPTYLARLFRNELQTSPYQHLQHLRLMEACRLLRQGASVTEACYRAGFNDCSHFILYFKRATGLTPKQFAAKSKV